MHDYKPPFSMDEQQGPDNNIFHALFLLLKIKILSYIINVSATTHL